MTLEIKQAKVQRCLAERKWRESGLTVHRKICVKQRNLVSNMISKDKEDYLCHKIVNCGSSQELFRLSSQMMGKFGDTTLPSNISPESVPDKFNEFFVHKIEEIRISFDPDRPIPTNPVELSGTVFAEFQLVTERCKNRSPGNAQKVLWPRPHTHLCPYCPSRTLHSLDTSLLTVTRFSLEAFEKRYFSVFGPTVWNSIPLSLRKTWCFTTFKTKLATHLFHIHLCWSASVSFCI